MAVDSETDFELEDEEDFLGGAVDLAEGKLAWRSQFLHLLEFSEDILPTALYEPMKWCHISIRDSLKHVAKTEEILRNMGRDTRLLEMQLEAWKRRRQSNSTSKSRLCYSIYLYKRAGDVFYFAFYQNRGMAEEIRDQMEAAFQLEFGSSRLARTRSLLKVYLRRCSQIEEFLSQLPEIYRSEVLAGLICDYLNPFFSSRENQEEDDDGKDIVSQKMNELLSSPDYHENQISFMLLAREDCLFKQVILDSMIKYVMLISDPLLESAAAGNTSTSTTNTAAEEMISELLNFAAAATSPRNLERTENRLRLFLDADPNLVVKACLATDNFPMCLFDIIAIGVNTISGRITRNRSRIFEDFRPPLFGKEDPSLSLPEEWFRFFKKMKYASNNSSAATSLGSRVKKAMSKFSNLECVNTQFWQELFVLLNDANYCCSASTTTTNSKHQKCFSEIYHDLFRPYW